MNIIGGYWTTMAELREFILDTSIPEPNTGCWLWLGTLTGRRYGKTKRHHRIMLAHRLSYEAFRGPIPHGLTIDHLCRQPPCVNPDHLEPVTMRENTLRGTNFSAVNARKTHCAHGHPFSEENTYRHGGSRHCRACNTLRKKAQ